MKTNWRDFRRRRKTYIIEWFHLCRKSGLIFVSERTNKRPHHQFIHRIYKEVQSSRIQANFSRAPAGMYCVATPIMPNGHIRSCPGRAARQERVLFIGTQFSILYTSMYSPAVLVLATAESQSAQMQKPELKNAFQLYLFPQFSKSGKTLPIQPANEWPQVIL